MEGLFTAGGRYNRGQTYLAARPGTERSYSDFAVDLAGYALARLVHEPFARYVARTIFVPLRMEATSYDLRELPQDRLAVGYGRTALPEGGFAFVPNRAAFGHLPAGHSAIDEQMGLPDPPSGTLYTSAVQFARLMMMLLNRGSLEGVKVLEPASVDLLLEPSGFWSAFGYQQGLILYATRNLDDQPVWGHDGQDRGYVSAAFFNRETRVGAVAFANANRDDLLLSRRLVDLDMHMMDWFK